MATLTEEVRQPIQSAIYAKAFQMAPHLDVDGVALLRYVKMTEQSCKSLNCLVRTHKYSTSPFSDKKWRISMVELPPKMGVVHGKIGM